MTTRFVTVVDFGQYSARGISQVLERLKVKHHVLNPNETPSMEPTHIILSGGPKHVYEEDHYAMPAWIAHTKAPVLGICYGMQLIAYTFGGHVRRMETKEEGPVEVTEIIEAQQSTVHRWMNRHDRVMSVPRQFIVTGVTKENHIAAFTDNNKWWGVQYHPEASKYVDYDIFRRFLRIESN
jgi:GMP synthase (glutamine-hydrolysing)